MSESVSGPPYKTGLLSTHIVDGGQIGDTSLYFKMVVVFEHYGERPTQQLDGTRRP